MTDIATLPLLLKQLQLSTIQSNLEMITKQAENAHWTYIQYLATLCDQELVSREQRRIQRILLEAKLPVGKTLDIFNFSNLTSINPAQINAFAEHVDWINQANNLLIFGPSGVGKTHLAAAIGRRVIELGKKALFTKTTALVQKLQVAHRDHKLSDTIARLSKFDLLILDDIGYVKKSEAETSVLFELIADRYESGSILITSNQPFDQWETIFPSNSMAVAAIDRLVHHATIINVNESSYRVKSKKKSCGDE